jgi:hypothetical protein
MVREDLSTWISTLPLACHTAPTKVADYNAFLATLFEDNALIL